MIRFLFYFSMVCFMAAVPAIVIGQLIALVLVSDDTGLFIGLFVFVGLVWQCFASRKPTV